MTNDATQVKQQVKPLPAHIGVVEMKADGTLILQLRGETDSGIKAEGYFRYPPGHPEYAEVLQHVGSIKPGESKPVRPWPETPTSAAKP